MPTTTTRLALSQPAGNDAPVGLRTSIAGNATILDQAVRIFEGTLVLRSSTVPFPAYGDEYYATDTLQWFKWNGSAWQIMVIAGAWQALTLTGGVTASGYTPSARLEGDLVRLKGAMVGTVTAGSTWATVPSGWRPSVALGFSVWMSAVTSSASFLTLSTAGLLTLPVNATGVTVGLDDITFTL